MGQFLDKHTDSDTIFLHTCSRYYNVSPRESPLLLIYLWVCLFLRPEWSVVHVTPGTQTVSWPTPCRTSCPPLDRTDGGNPRKVSKKKLRVKRGEKVYVKVCLVVYQFLYPSSFHLSFHSLSEGHSVNCRLCLTAPPGCTATTSDLIWLNPLPCLWCECSSLCRGESSYTAAGPWQPVPAWQPGAQLQGTTHSAVTGGSVHTHETKGFWFKV